MLQSHPPPISGGRRLKSDLSPKSKRDPKFRILHKDLGPCLRVIVDI